MRAAVDIIEGEGLDVLETTQRKGHLTFKVRLTDQPDGDTQRLFTGGSPSDFRWPKKFRSDARRLARKLRGEDDESGRVPEVPSSADG